jgi:hypothetical protein
MSLGCLRIPFSPLQPKAFSDASRWNGMRLSVILNVHAGLREKRRVESLPLRHTVWVAEKSGYITLRIEVEVACQASHCLGDHSRQRWGM